MRLASLLLLVSTTWGFYIPTNEEKEEAWARLNTVKDFSDGVPEGYKLVFVNPIWRHGDRGPTESFAGDVLTEDDWDFGGGGYGELSPIGMQQHFELGEKLYERYAKNNQFLSSRYRAKEIYARSTDRNRTLISAYSNFAGMYSRATAVKGTDYPDMEKWPSTFVPVPIHTENRYGDHVGDPDADCPRQDDLWELAHSHPEYIAFDNKDKTQQTLKYLRDKTNSNEDQINFDNVYLIRGGMLCESIHFNDSFSTWYPWYTDDVKQRVEEIDNQNIDFQQGIFASGWINGYDLTLQIPITRGGTLLNDVVAHAEGVMDCYETNNYGKATRCTENDHFLNNLKYYVVSAHDTTIAAYLTVLEAKPSVITRGGYPAYSAAVITEFFLDTNTNERYFRVLFHDSEDTPTDTLRVITPFVTGCDIGADFCKISALQALSAKYSPPGGIDDWCQHRLNGPAETSTVPAPKTSTPTTTTTKKADNGGATTFTVPNIPATTSPSSLLSSLSVTVIIALSNLFL